MKGSQRSKIRTHELRKCANQSNEAYAQQGEWSEHNTANDEQRLYNSTDGQKSKNTRTYQ